MLKEELVEGIREAMSRGEPIEKAMMSFYNSGYAKQDIEEAASAVQYSGSQQPIYQTKKAGIQPQPAQPTPTYQVQPQTQFFQTPIVQQRPMVQPGVIQRVSAYGPRPSGMSMAITIVLVAALLFLIGLLAAVILFKDEISTFFGNLAWAVLA